MNLEDIAKLAGVSRSTVSRVINADANVSAAVRARVQATIDEVGYRPNAAARALASQRSRAIGLIVPEDFSQYHVDPWYPLIIQAALAATREAGLSLVLIMEDTFSPGAGQRVIDQFIDTGRVDGLLVLLHSYRDHLTQTLIDSQVPTVLVGESDIPNSCWVDNDNAAGGERIASIFRRLGLTHAITLSGSLEHVPTARRLEGFRRVYPEARSTVTDYSVIAATSTARELLESAVSPQGVFAINGWVAPPVFTAAREQGLEIPQDLVVAAFDEFDEDLNESLGLTSIVQHVSELAHHAVRTLELIIEDRTAPREPVVLDTILVSRRSCREHDSANAGGAIAAV